MEEKEYLEQRLNDQLKWYGEKSKIYKKRFYCFRIATIVLGASIPVLTGFVSLWLGWLRVIAIVGALIAVMEGLNSLWQSQENWIRYRIIAENLKHEKYMYLTKTGIYRNATDGFADLVERVETIISSENINWANLQPNEKTNKGANNHGE